MPASFLNLASGWIVSLPHDLKVLFEAKDEPDLDRALRDLACGTILQVLTKDTSGETDFVGFSDSAILMRAVLQTIRDTGGEGAADLVERFPEVYAELDAELEVVKKALGDAYPVLVGRVDGFGRLVYRTKKVKQYMEDEEAAEALYEDSLAFATNYPIDEEKLEMRLKKPESLIDPLRRRAENEKKRRGNAA